MVALGSVAVLGAAVLIVGPIGVAITALATAMVAFTAINWDMAKTAAGKVGEFAAIIGEGIGKLAFAFGLIGADLAAKLTNALLDGLLKIPGMLTGIANIASDLAGMLRSAIESIPAQCASAISNMAANIGSSIAAAIGSITGAPAKTLGSGAAGAPDPGSEERQRRNNALNPASDW